MKRTYLSAVGIVLLFAVLTAGCNRSQPAPYHYDFIHIDIDILRSGKLKVQEMQKMTFTAGTFHYAFRWIPSQDADGIENATVSEGNRAYTQEARVRDWIAERKARGGSPGGNAEAFATWEEESRFWMGWWYPASQNTSRTFTLRYDVLGAVRRLDESHQLDWKAIIRDHAAPIRSGKVTLRLPEAVRPKEVELASAGCPATQKWMDERTVVFSTSRIEMSTGLNIHIRYPRLGTANENGR